MSLQIFPKVHNFQYNHLFRFHPDEVVYELCSSLGIKNQSSLQSLETVRFSDEHEENHKDGVCMNILNQGCS